MGGDILSFPQEPGGPGGVDLAGRVQSLEGRMTTVEAAAKTAAENSAQAVANTAELLALANATKSIAGFAWKHGPKVLSFGCGAMTILGFGNPKLWAYISHFLGY